MKKTLYVKYNATRNPAYQTRTEIADEGGNKEVIKSPLGKDAVPFINSFPEKYLETSSIFKNIKALPVEMRNGAAVYPVIKGRSLDSFLAKHLSDSEAFVSEIKKIFEKYYAYQEAVLTGFHADSAWHEIFGEAFDEKITGTCTRPSNIDMIFDNVILDENDSATCFDYEWTFDITCPLFYSKFRILSHIYDKYFSIVSKWIDFEDFVLKFDISEEEFALSMELEKHLMSHIYSGGEKALTDSSIFMKSVSLQEIKDSFALSEVELPKTRQLFTDTLSKLNNAALEMDRLNGQIAFMENSKSWKLTKPLRKFTNFARKIKNRTTNEGLIHGTMNHFVRHELEKNGFHLIRSDEELAKERACAFAHPVKISILTPLYNTPVSFLKEMIESAIAQTYAGWELVLIDFSPKENTEVENTVREYSSKDDRIIYERSENNIGIAENTNLCAERATGEYFAILDHDDVLHPSALFEVMKEIENGADFIYTDEIKFAEDTAHPYEPNYKPDFSYEQLQTQNFICHLNVYSRKLFDEVGGYRSGFNGSQDHDIVLRLTEKAEKIAHIPEVLYYWRVHEKSVASNIDAKPYATISGIKAINESYERKGLKFKVESTTGNIPRYRIITPEYLPGDIAVLIWGDKDREAYFKTIECLKNISDRKCTLIVPDDIGITENSMDSDKFSIKPVEGRILRGNALPDDYLKLISEKFSMEYLYSVLSGLEIMGDKCFSEYLALLSNSDITAVDSMLFSKKGEDERIFSGGAYFTGENSKPVALRGQGMVKEYEGFQADFTHVRAVSYVTNILTMYRRSALGSENQKYLWTPFVYGVGEEKSLKGIDLLRGNSLNDMKEPYFSREVIKNHLE